MKRTLLKTVPCLLNKVWGSDRLQRAYGKDESVDVDLGESWEVSALEEHPNRICGGAPDETLDVLFARDPAHFLGPERASERFPMLVKLLATSRRLSVQVHPNDAQALELEGRREGKWECWTVLEADPGAEIFLGIAPGFTREAFFAGIEEATAAEVTARLRRFEVRGGEFFVVPPGTIHAIGAGITLLEVQQPSDVTYRVYDWGRARRKGAPDRPLHLPQARKVVDVASRPGIIGSGEAGVLWDADPFRIERLRVTHPVTRPVTALTALVCLSGGGRVGSAAGESLTLAKGESCVVPRGATMIDFEGGAEALDLAIITARSA